MRLQDREIDMIFNKLDIRKEGKLTSDILKRLFKEYNQETNSPKDDNNNNNPTNTNDFSNPGTSIGAGIMEGTTTNNTFKSTQISDTLTIKKGMHFPKGKESISIEKSLHTNDYITFDYQYHRDIVSFFNLLMEIESEIEQLKMNMTFQADFNLCDCFTFFDKGRKGYLTERDLLEGLNSFFGNIIQKEDISLLMKRYDLNRQGVLNYQDFFDMLTPFTKDNRDIIERRYTHHLTPLTFSYLTKYQLTLLLKYLISSEQRVEKERQYISQIPALALTYIYSHIDRKQTGYFIPNEVRAYCLFIILLY